VLIVDRVVSVQVGILGDTIRVPGPESTGGVGRVETKRFGVLSKTVNVWVFGEVGLQTEVLALKDESVPGGVEERLTSAAAGDAEAEGGLLVLEDDVRLFGASGGLGGRTGNDRLGDFVALAFGVGDLDVDTSVYFCTVNIKTTAIAIGGARNN
jgi:hypothetical protein